MPKKLEPPPVSDELYDTEWGLRTPDGDVHWGTWQGRDLNSCSSRRELANSVYKTASELGWEQASFAAKYGWVSRKVTYGPVSGLALDDECAFDL